MNIKFKFLIDSFKIFKSMVKMFLIHFLIIIILSHKCKLCLVNSHIYNQFNILSKYLGCCFFHTKENRLINLSPSKTIQNIQL